MRDIGKNIRDLRCRASLTQEELADKLFVTRQTISNYENGKSRPDIDMLVKLGEVLNADVNTILYGIPKQENRKGKYKHLLFGLVAIIIIGSLVVYLNEWAMNLRSQTFLSSPYFILKVIINPMSYIAFGWCLMDFIALWTPVKPVNCKMTKYIRIVILCLACLIVAVLVPIAVFTVVGDLRVMRYDSVSMSFPYIPVYSELYRSFAIYNMKFAATYLVPGVLLYITGFPKKSSKF